MRIKRNILLLLLFLWVGMLPVCSVLKAQKSYDSLGIKLPKHYFNTVFVLDGYNKPTTKLDTQSKISRHLVNYGIKLFNLSFYIPLLTKDYYRSDKDTNVIANSHLLLTGNFLSLKPVFDGITQHTLTKRGVGLRYIYNSGKKGVWFADVAPFITRDVTYTSRPYLRLASTIVYSYNANDKLNFRIGATKSFLWGNRLYLPFIGLRIGRLDKLNLSIQFPRNISVTMPFNSNFSMSLYTRPQGGMFNFSNHDTLYPVSNEKTFHFSYYEINTGLRVDVRIGSHLSFFATAGVSSQNNTTFYSERANVSRKRLPYNTYFFSQNPSNTPYGQFGAVLRFGKTRNISNNTNMYDAIDLNSTVDINDGSAQIPIKPKRAPKNPNLESIKDLIDYNDY